MNSSTPQQGRVQIIDIADLSVSLNSLTLASVDPNSSWANLDISQTENLDNTLICNNTSDIRNNMAVQPTTEQLIAAARNYGDILPKYDGNPNSLETFIIKADTYYQKYGNTEDDTLAQYVFCMISSKFINEANDFVSCRSDLTDWPLLKEALRNKFGDLTDRKILAHQFKNLKLKPNEEINDFIERIKSVQNKLNIKIRMDNSVTAEQRATYSEIHEQTALEVLYTNCPPMLQTILDVKNPNTLNEAISTVLNYITKHPIEKQKPKPINLPKPQFFRPPQMNYPRQANYFRPPENNRFSATASGPPNFQRQTPQVNQNFRSSPQTGNNYQNRPNNAFYNNRPSPNPSSSNIRSNKFQGTVFRNWRQPKPLVNFAEVFPFEQEENCDYSYSPEYSEYDMSSESYSNCPYPPNYETSENPENTLPIDYWSMNENFAEYDNPSDASNSYSQQFPEVENFRLKASSGNKS